MRPSARTTPRHFVSHSWNPSVFNHTEDPMKLNALKVCYDVGEMAPQCISSERQRLPDGDLCLHCASPNHKAQECDLRPFDRQWVELELED
jgi:hypothetical protein